MGASDAPRAQHALAVTASQNGRRGGPVALARAAAERWRLPFLERPRKSGLCGAIGVFAEAFLVCGGDGWALRDESSTLRFTPGMAMLRVKRMAAGFASEDQLLRQAELRPGDTVLDGTLGLGADALVCAAAVGPSGRVMAVERSTALCALVAESLRLRPPLADLAPIECTLGDAGDVLRGMLPRSVDVVVLDPMFARPLKASPAFELLRRYASAVPLAPSTVDEALRVARRCVLVKQAVFRLPGALAPGSDAGQLPVRFASARYARLEVGAGLERGGPSRPGYVNPSSPGGTYSRPASSPGATSL